MDVARGLEARILRLRVRAIRNGMIGDLHMSAKNWCNYVSSVWFWLLFRGTTACRCTLLLQNARIELPFPCIQLALATST
jgi:hypothetical protein